MAKDTTILIFGLERDRLIGNYKDWTQMKIINEKHPLKLG